MPSEEEVVLDEFVVKYRASKLPPTENELRTVLEPGNLQENEKIKSLKRMSGGKTILHIAATRGHDEALTIMLKAIQSRKNRMELLLQTKKITWWACYNPFTRCNTVLHDAVYADVPQDAKIAIVKAIMELDGLQAIDRFTLLTKQNDQGLTALDVLKKMGDNYEVRALINKYQRAVNRLLNVHVSNRPDELLQYLEVDQLKAQIELLNRQLQNHQGNEQRNAPPNSRLGKKDQQKNQSLDYSSSEKYYSPEKNLCHPSTEGSEANNQVRCSQINLPESEQRLSD